MPSRESPCIASSLVARLVDGAPRTLPELVRTVVSVHYATGDPLRPVLCVATPNAVRLPVSMVVHTLPPKGSLRLDGTALRAGGQSWRVSRWWQPPRPFGLAVPTSLGPAAPVAPEVPSLRPSYDALDPAFLVGAGPGLTPAGDDVLAGALVTAHATGDDRLEDWRRRTRTAMATRSTTAVSRGMLAAALEGYATPQLADYLVALCAGRTAAPERGRLLALGSSSGAALLVGVRHTLATSRSHRGAA